MMVMLAEPYCCCRVVSFLLVVRNLPCMCKCACLTACVVSSLLSLRPDQEASTCE